ncbi:P-loop containing nucleoside triphosphate hydrolase protein [Xylariomycetidae sp. FL0641]|nr:P-loop containing nucleoside triphosphate hydrolase protein [Xylariomycetidae sp. FL0641]
MGGTLSIPTDPSRQVEVICAGYSRTGTSTMQLALEKLLDGPVMHGGTQILTREDAWCKKWALTYEAKRKGDKETVLKLLRELTAGFVAVADYPALGFIPELMEIYPNAKVVVTTREPTKFAQSLGAVAKGTKRPWIRKLMWPIPGWRWLPGLREEFEKDTFAVIKNVPRDNYLKAASALLFKWNQSVQDMVPPEKLMIMDLKEGWEPLCRFLGKPIPEGPIPQSNGTVAAIQMADDIQRRIFKIWVTGISTVAIIGFGTWQFWNRYGWPL